MRFPGATHLTLSGIEGIRKSKKADRRTLTAEVEQTILDTTSHTRPAHATHWSLAARLGVSRSIVQRIWRRHDIQTHRVEKRKISNDPKLEDKVREVGLHLDPPDRALVLGVDDSQERRRPALAQSQKAPSLLFPFHADQ